MSSPLIDCWEDLEGENEGVAQSRFEALATEGHTIQLRDFVKADNKTIMSQEEIKSLQAKHINFIKGFFDAWRRISKEKREKKMEEKKKKEEVARQEQLKKKLEDDAWEQYVFNDFTKDLYSALSQSDYENDSDDEDEERMDWEDYMALIRHKIMFSTLKLEVARIKPDDLSEVMKKIVEYLRHKPGPNPIYRDGEFVNRRPFREL